MNYDNLLEPQKKHALALLNSIYFNGFAFDPSPTGTGKTYSASWVAQNLNLPVVVICPKAGRKTWRDTMAIFNVKPHTIINYEKLVRGNTEHYAFDKKEYVNSKWWWESKGILIKFPKNAFVIIDECHKCKGHKSKNGEMLTALKNNGYKILLVSATAATMVTEMKSFGFVTQLHNGKNYYHFAKDHGAENDRFGGLTFSRDNTKAKQGMVKIHNQLFNLQQCASKMRIEDFGDIFPDNHVIAESFDLGEDNDKLQKVYDTMQEEIAKLDERAANYSSHVFAVIMKARRLSELCKVPVTTEWIIDQYEEGNSPVAFFNFTDSLESVEAKLVKRYGSDIICKIVGGQSEKTRDRLIQEFAEDKRRIALVNMDAGSAVISLHDLNGNYPRSSLLCPSWSAIRTKQALGRIYRANGKTKCVQKFLFASEIEERQRVRVQMKLQNISELNNGEIDLDDNDLTLVDMAQMQ